MAWWLFGKESKSERELRELKELISPDHNDDELFDGAGNQIAERAADGTTKLIAHPDGGENQVSPIADDGTPFVQLEARWDDERQGFVIEIDWNAPFLKHIIAIGVEGDTDFEVAAYGATLMAHQILETEAERRANEANQILEMRNDV